MMKTETKLNATEIRVLEGTSAPEFLSPLRLRRGPQHEMNTTRETQQFTEEHLEALRRAYNDLERIDPCSDTYQRFEACVHGCNDTALLQLAHAKIKFVSALARGVAIRRNLSL